MNNKNIDEGNNSNKENNLFPIMSPAKAAVFGLIAVFFIFQFGGGALALTIFGFDLSQADMNLMRLLTIGSQILFILFPAILLSKIVYVDVTRIVRLKFPQPREMGVFAIGMIILVPLLQNYLYIQNYFIGELSSSFSFIKNIKDFFDILDKFVEESYTQILRANNIFEILLVIFTVSVTPAICEEFFFRGFIQKSFEFKFKPFFAIFITSVFFGIYHFNPYGLIPLVVLGMYLGMSVYFSKSIIVPVVLHFLNNFIAIFAFYVFGEEEFLQSNVMAVENINSQLFSFIIMLVLFIGFIIFIIKNYNKFTNNEVQNDLPKL